MTSWIDLSSEPALESDFPPPEVVVEGVPSNDVAPSSVSSSTFYLRCLPVYISHNNDGFK